MTTHCLKLSLVDLSTTSKRVRSLFQSNSYIGIGSPVENDPKPPYADTGPFTMLPESYNVEDFESPESKAERELDIDNIIPVDSKDIDDLISKSKVITKKIQSKLLHEGASMLISYDDASTYAKAALKEGLDINVDIDSSVSSALSHILRLNIINAYVDELNIPTYIKRLLLKGITQNTVDDIKATIHKTTTSEKYSKMLNHMKGRFNMDTSDSSSQEAVTGVIKHREKAKASKDNRHAFNMEQDKGVRYEAI